MDFKHKKQHMLQAITNSLIVKPPHRYISNISNILKLSAIQNNTSVDPSDYVNIIGEVISLPKMIEKKREYEGFTTNDIRVGDVAIFSYSVIGDIRLNDGEVVFNNAFTYRAVEYFLCDITRVFGVIRDGDIIMVNGYVMGTPIEESTIILPAELRRLKRAANSELMHIGSSLSNRKAISAKQGDSFYVNPLTVQKYQIKGKPFIITTQEKVLGIKS